MDGPTSTADLARAVGVSHQTLNDYVRRGCPLDSPESILEWKSKNIARNGPPTIGERASGVATRRHQSHELDEAEQRAKIAKLEEEQRKLKLANDTKAGLLIHRDDARLEIAEVMLRVKQRMQQLPRELESMIPEDVRPTLTRKLGLSIDNILLEMSQWRPSFESTTVIDQEAERGNSDSETD